MRKIYLLFIMALLINCGEEAPLTPTPVKNWYVITPTEDMDEVDSKIYEIYRKHNVAIFYKDTIGSEDRGYRDSLGNTILFYKVMDLNYNVTSTSLRTEWENIDLSIPGNKNKMLPLLELIDTKLLPMLEGAKVYIPAIYFAQYIKQQQGRDFPETYRIRKTFDILGMSMDGYEELTDQEFCLEFLKESAAIAFTKYSKEFYDFILRAMEHRGFPNYEPWGKPFGNLDNSDESRKLMLHWMNLWAMDYTNSLKIELLEKLKNEDLNEDEIQKIQETIDYYNYLIESYQGDLMSDKEYEFYFREYGYCNYGFLSLFETTIIPTKEQDLSMYMELVFFSDESEIMERYSQFPIIMDRYLTIKKIFEESGFDIEKVGEILKQ